MRQTSRAQEPGLAGRTSPGEDEWGDVAQAPSRVRNRLLWSMGFPRQEYWIAIFLLLVQKGGRAPSPSRCHFMLAGLLVPELPACLRSLKKKNPSTVGGGGLMCSAMGFMQDIKMPGHGASALLLLLLSRFSRV